MMTKVIQMSDTKRIFVRMGSRFPHSRESQSPRDEQHRGRGIMTDEEKGTIACLDCSERNLEDNKGGKEVELAFPLYYR